MDTLITNIRTILISYKLFRPCSLLLQKGAELKDEIWQKLLLYAIDNDIVIYVQLANERGIYLHNVDDHNKFSLHKCIK
jgi:hypothetical protein